MKGWAGYVGQAILYAAFAAGLGYLADRPLHRYFADDKSQIKLSFVHGAARVEDCRRLSPQEIAQLPPNERRPNTCGRERVSALVQLVVDGRALYESKLDPTGIARDGPMRAYQKFVVSPGRHEIIVRLRDSKRTEGFDYERIITVDLKPLQNLAVDFKADAGGFIFR